MNRQELLKALEIVKPGLAGKEITIEQATSFCFESGNVMTYNDSISIRHPVPGLNVTGAIRADQLYSLLARTKKDDITIELEGGEIRIKAGKATAGLPLQAEIKLPLEELGQLGNWQPIPEGFIQALKLTIPSCGKNSAMPIMTCIYVRSNGLIVSSDNYRITRCTIQPIPVNNFLLPASSARDLIKYDVKQMTESKGWVHFKTDVNTIFSCRTFEGEYPEIDKYFNVTGIELELPKTISEILDRASVFSKKEIEMFEEKVVVNLYPNNQMKVRGEGDYGWIEETANIRYTGPEVRFSTNPIFFKEISTQLQSCILGSNVMKFTGENWEHVVSSLVDTK